MLCFILYLFAGVSLALRCFHILRSKYRKCIAYYTISPPPYATTTTTSTIIIIITNTTTPTIPIGTPRCRMELSTCTKLTHRAKPVLLAALCRRRCLRSRRLSIATWRRATFSSPTIIRAKWPTLDSHVTSSRPRCTSARAKANCPLGKVHARCLRFCVYGMKTLI